jgi:hypothetical protein
MLHILSKFLLHDELHDFYNYRVKLHDFCSRGGGVDPMKWFSEGTQGLTGKWVVLEWFLWLKTRASQARTILVYARW